MHASSTFIAKIHAYVRGTRATRRGAVPSLDAALGTHKEYPRFPRIALPAPGAFPMPLHEAMRRRASYFESGLERPLSPAELGTLLGNALGMREDSVRRHYPSGGALFPIETYLIGTVLEGHPFGAFHYHPKAHALEFLWEVPERRMDDILRTFGVPLPPVLVAFTGVWGRASVRYGDFAYLLGLLEAGHMAQNILLAATALGIGGRPVAGCDDAILAQTLDLDERTEQPVYSIALSPNASVRSGKALSPEGMFE